MSHRQIQPATWARPRGYANGVLAEGTKTLFIAGQIGWDPTRTEPTFPNTFAAQFDRALGNVAAVLKEAGGSPEHLTRVTVYVTDKRAYLAAIKDVGESWRKHLSKHFPAMTLVQVAALLEDAALVEIEATAVL
ncbi:MAG: RidA family protein [Myxococcaceae bacterium]